MSNLEAQSWISRAHGVINSGYDSAIAHYNNQKKQFLKQLESSTNEGIQDFMESLNQQIHEETIAELDPVFDEAFSAVQSYIEEYIVGLMENGNADYQALLNRFTQVVNKGNEGKVNPENLYHNLTKDLEHFLLINNITRTNLAQKVAENSRLENTANTDIQNNLFGYARKLILAQLLNQSTPSIQHYKTALKGYYKEELLVPALDKVLAQYGMGARQSGSERNEKGQQGKIDIGIGTLNIKVMANEDFNSMLQQFEHSASGSGQVEEFDAAIKGGIQSKSWILPWSQNSVGGNRSYLSFGHNAALMPEGEDAHYWHAGVYNVMSNLTEAIGSANFIFSTGDTVYWTAELLTEFKQNQYVFAFYWNKTEEKIISSDISAQEHSC